MKNSAKIANISYIVGAIFVSFAVSMFNAHIEEILNISAFFMTFGIFAICYGVGWFIACDNL